jgi:hypothetical protein
MALPAPETRGAIRNSAIKVDLPEAYRRLEAEYGRGGKGAGKHYSRIVSISISRLLV